QQHHPEGGRHADRSGAEAIRPQPMASAIGIVHPMLNTPQALSLSEFTTTSAMAARATIITNTIASAVAVPVSGLTCPRAMLASERPWLRTEAVRMTKSCTPPATTEPTSKIGRAHV